MKIEGVVDHLFRHHYGKMVATLVRIFGFSNLEMIEDAVQDTFIKAMQYWRNGVPENPEGWLTQAAKNRVIDLIRKLKADDTRITKLEQGSSVIAINEFFLDHEIADSQLRMIFTACHPKLNPKDQIAFALKTIGGFSDKEIAAALLIKQETVKKRLSRARKTIKNQAIAFSIPDKKEVHQRIAQVHEVLYLIFNEGFHSTKKELLIRKDLCGEAIRLCGLLLKKEALRTGEGYALFGLFCFHAARLDARMIDDNILVDLKNQDRTKWHFPLIRVGNEAMNKAVAYEGISPYHIEAAIAAEHLNAKHFDDTNWEKIRHYHQLLHEQNPSPYSAMNLSIVLLQLNKAKASLAMLQTIDPKKLEKRAYLYYGIKAEYYLHQNNSTKAIEQLDLALKNVSNESERQYLMRKKAAIVAS